MTGELDLDRRAFLRGALCTPFALQPLVTTTLWLPRGDQRTLLVLELQGGNDGLNTVVPVDDADYARLRPTLSAVRKDARPVGPGFALHRALQQLAARVTGGDAAIVHGVGLDHPDRSHFRSRDIWYTADPMHQHVRADTTGWLGRAADLLAAAGAGMPAASIGSVEVPLLLRGKDVVVPSLERADDYALRTTGSGDSDGGLRSLVRDGTTAAADSPLAFVEATAAAAIVQAEALRRQLARYSSATEYPDSDLGRSLQLCAQLAVSGSGTRLLHLGFSGFDTHAQQLATHDGLFGELDRALGAFLSDLGDHDRLAETVVFLHSEFGRRTQENRSLGTDHGAAAPVLLFGGNVRPGLHGTPPDLSRLVDGDVPATTDFRAVYADLLRWLGVDVAAVLGQGFAPLGLLPE